MPNTNTLDADSWYGELIGAIFSQRNALKYKEKSVLKIMGNDSISKTIGYRRPEAVSALKFPDNITSSVRITARSIKCHYHAGILQYDLKRSACRCITNLMMYGAYWFSEKTMQEMSYKS